MGPKWSTPQRRRTLLTLWRRYGGRCLQGHHHCPDVEHYVHAKERMEWAARPEAGGQVVPVVLQQLEMATLYGVQEEAAVETWKADDREGRSVETRLAQQTAPTGETGVFGRIWQPGRPPMDPIIWDTHCQSRPGYYLMSMGVEMGKPFAKVRVPGTGIILFVDTTSAKLGKNARKRQRRQGIKMPTVDDVCRQAVRQWLGA